MPYCTVAQVRSHLGITSLADDAYLGELSGTAQDIIELHCGRRFEAITATETFHWREVRDQQLHVGQDLYAVLSVRLDEAPIVLPPTAYVLVPYRERPAYAIEFMPYLVFQTVEITAQWGYSLTAPPVIRQAAIELVGDMYFAEDRRSVALQKGAEAYRQARELPPRVLQLLRPYVRGGL